MVRIQPADTGRIRTTAEMAPLTQVDLGYRWAAVQIPLQYLPWIASHRTGGELAAAAGRAAAALAELR